MTVTTTSNRNDHIGDGSTTLFAFTFAIQQSTDMTVYFDGVVKLSGYVVSINSNGVGGTVSFSVAPSNDVAVSLLREVEYTQETSLPTETNIPEATLENAYDKNTMLAQQLKEITDRCLKLSVDTVGVDANLPNPTDTPGYVLVANDDGDGFELKSANEIFNDMEGGGYGDVIGPVSSTANGLPLFNGTTGKALKDAGYAMPTALGATDTVMKSDGSKVVFGTIDTSSLLKANAIPSTNVNTLPSSAGLLSGTYLHYGDWTPTANGSWTIAHDCRIYVKGAIDLGASATLTRVLQSNGAPGQTSSNVGAGSNGSGPSGGCGGTYTFGGGGGGSYGLGGRGGYSATNNSNNDAQPAFMFDAGGSGGGCGSGDGTSVTGKKGGDGGPAWSIECTSDFRCGNIDISGGNGTNGASSAGAGGGGGGGCGSVRAGGNIVRGTVTVAGGNGGNTSGTGIKGGGGGGGYFDEWAGGTITGGAITTSGGTKGTGSAPTSNANDGGSGASTSKQGTPPISLR